MIGIHGLKKYKLGYVPVFGYWERWQRLGRVFYKYYTVLLYEFELYVG